MPVFPRLAAVVTERAKSTGDGRVLGLGTSVEGCGIGNGTTIEEVTAAGNTTTGNTSVGFTVAVTAVLTFPKSFGLSAFPSAVLLSGFCGVVTVAAEGTFSWVAFESCAAHSEAKLPALPAAEDVRPKKLEAPVEPVGIADSIARFTMRASTKSSVESNAPHAPIHQREQSALAAGRKAAESREAELRR